MFADLLPDLLTLLACLVVYLISMYVLIKMK